MADILCVECKSEVSDESGYCPECGFPFENSQPVQESIVDATEDVEASMDNAQPNTVVTTPLDVILRSLDSLRSELEGVRGKIEESSQIMNTHLMTPDDGTQKMLADISTRIDTIAAMQVTMQAALQPDDNKKTKNALLTAFYKTLNSPNSMFEYMFYICVVQIIFVIVNLFLATYIVTLVR